MTEQGVTWVAAVNSRASPLSVSASLLPNLLGIGAAKCGTTWLAGVLAAHPDVFLPPQKELNALHYDDLDQRLSEYMTYFAGAGAAKIRCDFSVRYLASPTASDAAKRLVPHAKILVVLRNPIDQIQSHYWHLLRQNFHQGAPVWPRPDLFAALEGFPTLLLEPALYGKHLQRWRERFPPESILVIDHADFARSTPEVLSRICDFLDISRYDFSSPMQRQAPAEARRGVRPRSGALGAIFPRLYVALAQGPYRWLKTHLGVRHAETIKRTLRLRQISEKVFFEPGYPKLASADRSRLFEMLEDDLKLLVSHTEIDVTAWRPDR